jgi:hypothetical protein
MRVVGIDEKGKPIARWGRKVTGLFESAGLSNRSDAQDPIGSFRPLERVE